MVPNFLGNGLPSGIHRATLGEVRARLAWNQHRTELIRGLSAALTDLAFAGCRRVWLDGSFVTPRDFPNDYDLAWDRQGVKIGLLHPVLLDVAPPRRAQQVKYRGDILPNVVEANSGMPFLDFFQQDPITGDARGIVEIRLKEPAR